MTDDSIRLDFARVDSLPRPPRQQELIVKVKSPRVVKFKSGSIKLLSESLAEVEGSYQYTLRLSRTVGRKEAQLDFEPRPHSS
jgi:hypothetical protein